MQDGGWGSSCSVGGGGMDARGLRPFTNKGARMRRGYGWWRSVLVVGVVALGLSGCIEQGTVVTVQPDGSGTIHLQMAFSPKLAENLPGTEAGATGDAAAVKSPLAYDEARWQAKAKEFGPEVRFVGGKEVTTPAGWKGYTVDYAFADISKVVLRVEEGQAAQPGEPPPPAEDAPGALPNKVSGFTFTFVPAAAGAPATLVAVPTLRPPPANPAPVAAAPAHKDPKEAENERAMARKLLTGMRISTTLVLAGTLSASDAHRVAGDAENAVVLLDLNLDKVMADDGAFQKFIDSQDAPIAPDLTGLPGFRAEEQPVTVKFQ